MRCNSDCPLCHGEGLVELENGSWDICPNTPLDYSGTGVDESDRRVPERLPVTKVLTVIGKALKTLRDTGYGMIWIQGDYGIGKTVLAKAATVEAYSQYKSALYRRQLEMINFLRAVYSDGSGGALLLVRKAEITSVRWLVIDEIGRVNPTPFAEETMGEIVDTRYQMALKQTGMTVLIGNDAPEKVLSPYLVDRVRDVKNKVLVAEGKSLRKG